MQTANFEWIYLPVREILKLTDCKNEFIGNLTEFSLENRSLYTLYGKKLSNSCILLPANGVFFCTLNYFRSSSSIPKCMRIQNRKVWSICLNPTTIRNILYENILQIPQIILNVSASECYRISAHNRKIFLVLFDGNLRTNVPSDITISGP